ncbi:MAG TPA: amidohydrolase family protein [Clostridiales bacterium]|nr:amidohydrolase family protein [Clostridiales bacterium]
MNIPKKLEFFRQNPVVNWHEHVQSDKNKRLDCQQLDSLVRDSELVGIDINVVSRPYATKHFGPEVMEFNNNIVAEAMSLYPGKIQGFAFIDPIHGKYAVREIDRCVQELGMIGVKLYDQFTLCDDMQNPIIERCIELDIPILMHAGKACQHPLKKPLESDSTHFIAAAKKYPEAVFIMGHIGGGGDWNWQLKGMEKFNNVFTDISGSVHDDMLIEETVRVMGANRVLFATDGSFSSSIGKLLDADINDEDKKIIMNNPSFIKYLNRGRK